MACVFLRVHWCDCAHVYGQGSVSAQRLSGCGLCSLEKALLLQGRVAREAGLGCWERMLIRGWRVLLSVLLLPEPSRRKLFQLCTRKNVLTGRPLSRGREGQEPHPPGVARRLVCPLATESANAPGVLYCNQSSHWTRPFQVEFQRSGTLMMMITRETYSPEG